jgi:2-amino-4-hydroxy-6-hydroxymethyldihydropteridine diphosphokinase
VGTAYVALGANLGDRIGTLTAALEALGRLGTVEAVSPMYETDPAGYVDQPAFLNAVARLKTVLPPRRLLEALHEIESAFGRTRTFRNAPRTLDLDLLLYDDLVIDEPELVLPHPRLHERAFVLVPLAQIAGGIMHPVLQRSVADLLRDLGEIDGVRPWTSDGGNPPLETQEKGSPATATPKERRERR